MINKGKPEGKGASRIIRFMMRLFKKAGLCFLGLSFLSTVMVYGLLTAYPDEWDEVNPKLGRAEAELICGPPTETGAWPEKQILWRWGLKWIHWEFIIYGDGSSKTNICFFKNYCTDFKDDQSYKKRIMRALRN